MSSVTGKGKINKPLLLSLSFDLSKAVTFVAVFIGTHAARGLVNTLLYCGNF